MSTKPTPSEAPLPGITPLLILKDGTTIGDQEFRSGDVVQVDAADAEILVSAGLAEIYTKTNPERQVRIRVIKHGAKIGSFICAATHEQLVSRSKADVMVRDKEAEIIGV